MKTPREPQRLAKVLAERGIASRGEADRMIERGWVRVDGRVAVPGQRAAPDVEITLSPEAEARLHAAVTVLLNKPSGFVSAPDETGGARAQSLLVHANYDGRGVAPEWSALGLRVAGRLAVQDAGLVIYTTDTALARRLALPEVDESWRFRFLHGRRPGDHGLCLGLEFDQISPEDRQKLFESLRGLSAPEPLRPPRALVMPEPSLAIRAA